VFLDIDGFPIVNGDYGHLVGNDILARLGTWLAKQAQTLRGRAYRVAGDKFALLLPERNLVEAAQIANTIVASCPSLPLPLPITFSAAVIALSRDRVPSRALIDELGNELYRAELASGRNHSTVVRLSASVLASFCFENAPAAPQQRQSSSSVVSNRCMPTAKASSARWETEPRLRASITSRRRRALSIITPPPCLRDLAERERQQGVAAHAASPRPR
jgi:diguanylate cyclase (GGDEF)-like protein